MDIKPIETEYKGYRFRSRLEARWAVFFDSIGSKWKYEAEGYEIDGVRYLPDFEIENDGHIFFVEVKPCAPNETELNKADLLAKQTGCFVSFVYSDPFEIFENLNKVILIYPSGGKSGVEKTTLMMVVGALKTSTWLELVDIEDSCKIAAKKARQARFEFGETPL